MHAVPNEGSLPRAASMKNRHGGMVNIRITAKWRYNEAARALGRAASRTVNTTPLSYVLYAIQFALTFVAYYFAARFALDIGAVNTYAAPLWPPTGIAIAAVFFGGYRLAPAILAAAFLTNFMLDAPILACIAIAFGNMLEAVVGVYLLRNFNFRPFFDRMGDSISFIAVCFSVPFVSAVIGPVALALTGTITATELPETSLVWWIGDVLGALIVAPFILKWFARPVTHVRRSVLHWLENLLFFIALTTLAILVFLDPVPALREVISPYQLFVPLTWGALRVGPRFLLAGLLTLAAVASIGTVMDLGSFAGRPSPLLHLQLFLGTISTIFLLFVAAVEERKRATQELRAHVIDLQEDVEEISEADRAKNEFIAILSHELRNPLAPVLSALELLRLKSDTMPHFKEALDSMHEQIGRITRLLDDLLDITRISKKKFNLQVKRVRLQDILRHSITTVEETVRKRNHRLVADIPADPMWIDADPLRLEQVVVNLLNNAAKYTDPGGTITLRASRTGNTAEIRVRDTGIGLPSDMLGAIFEPFRQIRNSGENGSGLGIGLSLSQRFVELHGGTIEARSDGLGRGSEFLVCLPLVGDMYLPEATATTEAARPAHDVTPQAPQNKPKRTVLIVDDNEAAAHGIAQLLSHAGHDVRVAHDGSGALRALANFRPEIIILDIGLPDASGYDLARNIREYLDPQPLLVALTGFGQEEDQRRAYESGFDYHLTKPVSIADLEKILAK
jgi:signal transduction histidine kinase/CheY-like chemotaxis protein